MADDPIFPADKLTEIFERLTCRENPHGTIHCNHPRLRHGEHGPYVPFTHDVVLVCCWCGHTKDAK